MKRGREERASAQGVGRSQSKVVAINSQQSANTIPNSSPQFRGPFAVRPRNDFLSAAGAIFISPPNVPFMYNALDALRSDQDSAVKTARREAAHGRVCGSVYRSSAFAAAIFLILGGCARRRVNATNNLTARAPHSSRMEEVSTYNFVCSCAVVTRTPSLGVACTGLLSAGPLKD